ncbi:3-hydroxyisobutyryl-CoA hydrolase-like protein 1, mitochondrial isoform X1 [Nicotiana tomentosiformis]|uniref:3-hydroxyisobutyryl-CoA hydrolase n=1 Tax=Nicotiana tabacum TaxID=4097 RepID=A0A1S4BNN3_TOBAC|nr:3-hydroxyisobutyryl-CoA hydrolase-like protein 1, mitochondrial isoform X2 [Nicotiana tomentosiformis]XP_016490478.1 PREDICTED: 3-hydroxyisobutyryl-CoA hydrolase-like protein 1, mitochondrial isoform X1 [Nicotiana tabacum]
MQSFKSASILRRLLQNSRLVSQSRSFCSVSSNGLVDEPESTVLVEGKASSRTAILNRPHVLNALNYSVVDRLLKLYKNWEDDPAIGFVVLKGSGKAFSAGGDIVTIYNLLKQGNLQDCKDFCWTINNLVYVVGTLLKPHVALLNGITMGGGAGISIPGTFRVATEKTVFATPETLIGYHPDAGASFYLSHLPGHLGEYLALTGDKINGAEMISCGLATHYLHSAKLPLIEEQLGKLMTDDPSVIERSLENCGEIVHPDPTSVLHRIETLNKCFSHDTVEEIIDALESEAAKKHDAWCILTLRKLRKTTPLSLKVSLRSIREGRHQTLDQCLIREYRMSVQAFSGQITNDFCEGVRARLVDRDFAPKWDPPSLDKVTDDMVDQYFSRLTAFEPELELPTQQREAFT